MKRIQKYEYPCGMKFKEEFTTGLMDFFSFQIDEKPIPNCPIHHEKCSAEFAWHDRK